MRNSNTNVKSNSTWLMKRVKDACKERLEIRRLNSSQNLTNPSGNNNIIIRTMSPRSKSAPHSTKHGILEDDHITEQEKLYLSHGSVSICGRRREMEDAVTIAPGFVLNVPYDFFGVYDGHGGLSVAQVCRERLHRIIGAELSRSSASSGSNSRRGDVDWEKTMILCFSRMDDEINGDGNGKDGRSSSKSNLRTIGSTAVVAIVGIDKVVVANCGDSRAVLSRADVAVPLSYDHKPGRPDEMERVEAAGGRVLDWNGHRILGVLTTSRSIGDYYLKPYVISEPEVILHERTVHDEFLILASDGLWDVMANEVACEVVRRCLDGQMGKRFSNTADDNSSSEAAAVLVELAMARGSKDNISVVVVELSKRLNGC